VNRQSDCVSAHEHFIGGDFSGQIGKRSRLCDGYIFLNAFFFKCLGEDIRSERSGRQENNLPSYTCGAMSFAMSS